MDVVVEEAEGDALQGRFGGLDLGEHVDAVALFLDHPRHPADLAFDPGEAFQQLVLGSAVSGLVCHGKKIALDIP
jgi:hypothetical protein